MLRLSPLLTAAKAAARAIPRARGCRDRNRPLHGQSLEGLRQPAEGCGTLIDDGWSGRRRPSPAPVGTHPPQPMMTMCTVRNATPGRGMRSVLGRRPAHAVRSSSMASVATDFAKRIMLGRLSAPTAWVTPFAAEANRTLPVSPPMRCRASPCHPGDPAGAFSGRRRAVHPHPWIALAVALVMVVVVASYRQNVHACPSGGGDYEVATENLGPNAGVAVASALRGLRAYRLGIHCRSGGQCVVDRADHGPPCRARLDHHHRGADSHEPARRSGIRHPVRHPHLRLRARNLRDGHLGRRSVAARRHDARLVSRLYDQTGGFLHRSRVRPTVAKAFSSGCVRHSPVSRRSAMASPPSASRRRRTPRRRC